MITKPVRSLFLLFLPIVLIFGCASLGNYWSIVSSPQEGGQQFVKITDKNDLVDTSLPFAVSKDGQKIAFTSWKSGNGDIYIKFVSGSKAILQRTFRPETELSPNFSPDGSQLVYNAFRDGHYRIYMVGAESGAAIRQITSDSPPNAENPVVSPDGQMIAFNSVDYAYDATGRMTRVGNESLWTYDIKTGMLSQYTSGLLPEFSPDGKKLFFKRASAATTKGYYGLWMIDLASGSETDIISGNDFGIGSFAVSPDGKKIVFSSEKETRDTSTERVNNNLWVVNIDGTNLTQLTFHLSDDLWPVWAPDMSGIYFLSSRGEENKGTMNIWRMSYAK
jgi:Tol biopolymer transport system component